jgi:hypothetical protein
MGRGARRLVPGVALGGPRKVRTYMVRFTSAGWEIIVRIRMWGQIALAFVVVAAALIVLPRDEATAGPMNNPNSIWLWCDEDGGKKVVNPDSPFVLPVPHHGTVGLLVLKSGTGDGAYAQFVNPTPGASYEHPSGGDLSFAIWCRGGTPAPE